VKVEFVALVSDTPRTGMAVESEEPNGLETIVQELSPGSDPWMRSLRNGC
jgi:hypothetical protein